MNSVARIAGFVGKAGERWWPGERGVVEERQKIGSE